ncbi:hypothetical protein ACH4VX_09410 [Streptomyces sp. NPDC020731]|uniref:hypothetical protein n=1 Tax=Streptomyces sp. NPDC020731 TaxID=3365085 RepID=UPI0037902909
MRPVSGAWPTVRNGFRQWHDAGVLEALLEGLMVEAAKRGEVDLSLVGTDSTTARAHHDAVTNAAAAFPGAGISVAAAARGAGMMSRLRGVGPRTQVRAATSRAKAAMMTATRT